MDIKAHLAHSYTIHFTNILLKGWKFEMAEI